MPEQFDPYHKWLGIRPEEQPPSHYRLLGITQFEDDQDTIANTADQRMAHIRSFQMGKHAALSQRLLNEVSAAKVCLLNSGKKLAYDEQLRKSASRPIPIATPLNDARRLDVEPIVPTSEPAGSVVEFDFGQSGSIPKSATVKKASAGRLVSAAVVVFIIVLVGIAAWSFATRNGGKESNDDVEAKSNNGPNNGIVSLPTPVKPSPATPPLRSTATTAPRTTTAPVPKEVMAEPKAVAKTELPKSPDANDHPAEATPEVKAATLSERQDEFNKAIDKAASADEFREVVRQGFALANRATTESNQAIAKAVAKDTLVIARKSGDSDLIKQATLLLIQVQTAPTPGKPTE